MQKFPTPGLRSSFKADEARQREQGNIKPGFPEQFMTNAQDFDSMELMETIQAIITILIWRT
ncbi:MAG: hypothetical protein ACYSUP_12110 [Planctomycetota bacterium]|jgi:hypothetical protein